jgi:hypothetical protein
MKKKAILYHSEMTDINIYFIHESNTVLLENDHIFGHLFMVEDESQKKYMLDRFEQDGILIVNDEEITDDEILDGIEIIKEYSYRF